MYFKRAPVYTAHMMMCMRGARDESRANSRLRYAVARSFVRAAARTLKQLRHIDMASSLRPSDWNRLTDDAFTGELSELGWKGKYKYDDPEVVELRSQLDQHAGIPDMELVDPGTPGYAARAAFLLNRDGVRIHYPSFRLVYNSSSGRHHRQPLPTSGPTPRAGANKLLSTASSPALTFTLARYVGKYSSW